ncbi:hypothetical protein F7725_003624 [Dissostichus mawsoni]|uniref:Uncharacterized protein n=1 Tax=Dissostichus mawsoni TaxID=36200 RepID=A0A7J5YAQ0_DISMA|nr:hypothetical protein F7725_003624 [Dissostichus mawsoni]
MFPSTGRGGQRTEDTQFNMMDYRTGLLLLTVCWAVKSVQQRRRRAAGSPSSKLCPVSVPLYAK